MSLAPRTWRIALLRDLYEPPNNLDNPNKPPWRAALQHRRNHYCRWPREQSRLFQQAAREGGPPTSTQSTLSHLAPRTWRVALLRDLYEPTNNLDNPNKPPGRAALQHRRNHYCRWPREPGGSRSCATRMSPRTISIISTSRPGGRPSNIGAIIILVGPANLEGRASARLVCTCE